LAGWAISLIITVILLYVFASCYKTGITDKRAPWQGCPTELGLRHTNGEWKYTTFQCFDNCDYCMYGWCCESCRLGDTYTMTNIGPSYLTYIHCFVAVMVIGSIVRLVVSIIIVDFLDMVASAGNAGQFGFYVGNIVLAYWLSGQRAKLRQALGDPWPEAHRAQDFCCFWCCLCCSVIQEGRQVDEITNTQTKCTFQLLPLLSAPPVVVGQPNATTALAVGGTGSVYTFYGPDEPKFANLTQNFLTKDIDKIMPSLGLNEPIPLWWTTDFILSSPEGTAPADEKWIVGEFNCSCVGISKCLPGYCKDDSPNVGWKDIPAEDQKRDTAGDTPW